MPTITAILNTYNEGRLLEECLLSIRPFVDEIIVTDMKSDDDSRDIALRFGCKVISIEPRPIVEETFNEKIGIAKSEWILSLDPDNRVPEETWAEIRRVMEQPHVEAIVFHERNQVFGRWIDHGHGSKTDCMCMFKRERYLRNGMP